ncbi:hypothetical protein V2J09_000811 [Rumex salicifolius]
MQPPSIFLQPLSNGIQVCPIFFFSLKPVQNPIFKIVTLRLSFASPISLQPQPMPPSSPNIVAEYAKSNRSTCKGCNNSIAEKELMLGLTSRDPRGFENTKWHHMGCFLFDLDSTESIKGIFGVDQEAVKKLLEDVDRKSQTKIKRRSEDVENKTQENDTKKQGIKPRSEDVENETQENHTKKQGIKRSSEDAENDTQENHSKKQGIKRSSEDVENDTQENHSKKQGIKRRSDDFENKTQENHTKKQRLSVTSEAKLEVALPAFDIVDKYKDATLLRKWKAFHTVIFLEKDDVLVDCSRVAAFDFDGCLVNTSVKRIGADAWSLMYPTVPEKLQKLHKDGFKLVIFTNESNIDRWINKRQRAVDSKIGRLNNFIKTVNVPIQVFIACGFDRSGAADPFRKPKPGMWHVMETKFNSGIKIDMDQSFYVGDAAGRRSDHSDADIKFAEVLHIYTIVFIFPFTNRIFCLLRNRLLTQYST